MCQCCGLFYVSPEADPPQILNEKLPMQKSYQKVTPKEGFLTHTPGSIVVTLFANVVGCYTFLQGVDNAS